MELMYYSTVIFEGTYRDKDYPLLTGEYLGHHKWFEILMSYSKDGVNWSNPVEIYVSKNNGTKSSAPFILCTDNNQLIVSFQTDEESYDFGYDGDIYSIMKVMISKPGIPIEEINQNSFYALCNNNNSPIGSLSNWNGMMLIGNKLYTVSSENTIKYSEIPIYEEPNKYNIKLSKQYYIIKGNITTYGDKIISMSEEIFVINKKIDTEITNTFYTYITPNSDSSVGLIFGINSFELAEKYRTPVFILADGAIGQMMEKVELFDQIPRKTDAELPQEWATTGRGSRKMRNFITSLNIQPEKMEVINHHLQEKYRTIEKNETRFETYKIEDADYIFTGFGLGARICKKAADMAREKGFKVGVIRPITLYPFPTAVYQKYAGKLKGILDVEMNSGQMVEDVRLAVGDKTRVEFYGRMGGMIPAPDEILEHFEKIFIK